MVSSSIPGDARIAPCAAASTSTYIRRTKSVASKSKASVATTAAKVARVDWRSKVPPPSSQRVTHSTSTDTKMTNHYNKRPKPQSPPTTPNNVSALVPVAKKNKSVNSNLGHPTVTQPRGDHKSPTTTATKTYSNDDNSTTMG